MCFKEVENGSFYRRLRTHSTGDCAPNRRRARAGQRWGWSKLGAAARNGGQRSPRHAQRGYAESRACAPRRATDLLHKVVKAGLAAPGEAELPRERLSHVRKAAYDAAHLAARVISPFRHALKSVMFLKRVRRPRAAIAFCPRWLQPSSLSSKGLLAQLRLSWALLFSRRLAEPPFPEHSALGFAARICLHRP